MVAVQQHGLFRQQPDTDPHTIELQHFQPYRQRNQIVPTYLHGYLMVAVQQHGLFR